MTIQSSVLKILSVGSRMLAANCTLDPTLNGDPVATPCSNSKVILNIAICSIRVTLPSDFGDGFNGLPFDTGTAVT